jgi:hypothetical protein
MAKIERLFFLSVGILGYGLLLNCLPVMIPFQLEPFGHQWQSIAITSN